MSRTLNATRKAVEVAKEYGGIPMVIKIIKGSALADTIQNTLTLTWVFATRAYLIVEQVDQIKYWMVLLPCIPLSYIFSRQIAKSLIAIELHSGFFSPVLGVIAGLITFLLSFGGLADGMFQNISAFSQWVEPKNAMKLLTIFVISAAPISSIKIGVIILKRLVSQNISSINQAEIDLVEMEFTDIQAEETKKYIEAKKAKIEGKKGQPKGNNKGGKKEPQTLAEIKAELGL